MGSVEAKAQSLNQVVDAEEVHILRNTLWSKFTDHEVDYCVKVSNALRLRPILKQIHFLKNEDKNGKVSITNITAIDGLRLAAQRTGEYAGSDDAIFEYDTSGRAIKKATVSIYRIVNGIKCAFTASARWDEYCPAGNKAFMWNKMSHVMLSKCAEAQALRKGFPAELSSLYVDAEMDQSQTHDEMQPKVEAVQAQVTPVEKPQFAKPVEHPASGIFCDDCDMQLIMDSKKKGYYCPRFKFPTRTGQPHSYVPVSKVEEVKKRQAVEQNPPDIMEPVDLEEDHDDLIHD